jgi:hypothetical protein
MKNSNRATFWRDRVTNLEEVGLSHLSMLCAFLDPSKKSLMIQIRATRRAARVPHRHVLAALAFDVVANDARAKQAAARAAAGRGDRFGRIIEDV